MRDGAFIDETRLTGGSRGNLSTFAEWEHLVMSPKQNRMSVRADAPARRAGRVRGRALLLFRLARQDIRHHLAQAVLLVVAIAAATAVLTLAFALNGVNTNPYQQTMAATKGPDVVAQSGNDPYTGVTSPAALAALVALNHAKGVAGPQRPLSDRGRHRPGGPRHAQRGPRYLSAGRRA